MISTRNITLAALSCAISALVSCAHQDVDQQVEQQLTEHRITCLSRDRPAYSPEHTDCVLARYEERQRQVERLRNAVAPPPPPPPPAQWPAADRDYQPQWME